MKHASTLRRYLTISILRPVSSYASLMIPASISSPGSTPPLGIRYTPGGCIGFLITAILSPFSMINVTSCALLWCILSRMRLNSSLSISNLSLMTFGTPYFLSTSLRISSVMYIVFPQTSP
ncbi:MAG: membrane protein [Candidatus Syntrophoarchaeum butanivorans]|uniref:Membrane protein n=1 Tax=Candidatus Syntropharchaeum butanivorans TaxID=1839936 RepID=A0A1F2P6I0_9EURY|nr:MAG: membrane protein [Candidatus Syntrophoarchaeum butanivorans]